MQAKLWWFKRLWKVEKSNYFVAFSIDKSQNLFDFHILPQKCILDICNSRKVLQSLKIENKFNKKKCCPKQIFLYHFHVQKDSESDDCWQPLDTKIVLYNFW